MPIKSYLVHLSEGKKAEAMKELSLIPACEAIPSENHDVIVLVTDTESKQAEKDLELKLAAIEHIDHLALVAGYNDPENNS